MFAGLPACFHDAKQRPTETANAMGSDNPLSAITRTSHSRAALPAQGSTGTKLVRPSRTPGCRGYLGCLPLTSAAAYESLGQRDGATMPFDGTRVIGESGRTLTVENDDGDQFAFDFPTAYVFDIRLEGQPVWKRGSEPDVASIWIDDAKHVATEYARGKGWLTP